MAERFINADYLLESISFTADSDEDVDIKKSALEKWIKNHTVKVKKTGKWLPTMTMAFFYCSVCRELVDWKTNYCPHCGADMKEDLCSTF